MSSKMSLSARRAWIEMALLELIPLTDPVALRKESVDRNRCNGQNWIIHIESLSARRAWIEISTRSQPSRPRQSLSARRAWIEIRVPSSTVIVIFVALRKESVDRNHQSLNLPSKPIGRSPQGERG